MDENGKPRPTASAAGRKAASEREARRAAALRANLRKRKSQQRGRDAAAGSKDDPAD